MIPNRFPEDLRRRATYFAGGFLPDTDLRFDDLVYHMCLALEMERLEAWAREERLRELGEEVIRKLVEAVRMAKAAERPFDARSAGTDACRLTNGRHQ